jgi:hypothetical protein
MTSLAKKTTFNFSKNLFTAILVICSFFTAHAQETPHKECGVELTPESALYLERSAPQWKKFLKNYDPTFENRSADYIPIQAHIMRTNEGTGGLTKEALDDAIANANAFFIPANVQFFLCGDINYIDDDTYYNFNKSQEDDLVNDHYLNNVLNIYFAHSVISGNSGLCGYAKFPVSSRDLVMMANDCVANGSTFVHELGHYFGLLHTHETYSGRELVDGSNCETAGDHLCDTPADPRLSFSLVNAECEYTGELTDANDEAYDPDPSNLMSYSRKHCRDYFSPDQYARIAYFAENYRSDLVCGSEYCESQGGETTTHYIATVGMGSINNESGNDNGFGNFRDVSTILHQGANQQFRLEAATTGTAYEAYWRIWIDFNRDNDFNDEGELIYSRQQSIDAQSNSPLEASFSVPAGISEGHTRMRVSMKVGGYATPCETFETGETEDYTVYLTDDYCNNEGNSTNYEWIESISIGNLTNASGNNNGYGNYTHMVANAQIGGNLSITLTPGFSNNASYDEYWAVWIDYNQDGDFEDAGEKVFSTETSSNTQIQAQINIPDATTTGLTRMRVVMRYGGQAINCGNFHYGEVEDYALIISQPYCESSGQSTNFEFIDRVIFSTVDNTEGAVSIIDNPSGNNGGYGDFTNMVVPIQMGLAYPFVAVPGFNGYVFTENWKVWIDYNQDGDFEDDGELILEENDISTAIEGIIHFPADALEGFTRMRISMSYDDVFYYCSNFSDGEVEDYTLMVLPMSVGTADQAGVETPNLEVPTPTIYPGEASAERNTNLREVSISPNPSTVNTTISVALANPGMVDLKVYSATGQLVTQAQLQADRMLQHTINCQGWAEGLYLIQISDGQQQITKKWVVSSQ